MSKKCNHDRDLGDVFTVTESDPWGNEYSVCEDCGEEVEEEDTRSFYIDEDTGRVAW